MITQELSSELLEMYEEELVNLIKQKKILEENKKQWIENGIVKISETTLRYFTNPHEIININNVSIKRDFINTLFEGQLFYIKKWGIQTPSFPFVYQLYQDLNIQNNHLVNNTNLTSTKNKMKNEVNLDNIIDLMIKFVFSQHIYYHKKNIILYEQIIDDFKFINVDTILSQKQKVLYDLKQDITI